MIEFLSDYILKQTLPVIVEIDMNLVTSHQFTLQKGISYIDSILYMICIMTWLHYLAWLGVAYCMIISHGESTHLVSL